MHIKLTGGVWSHLPGPDTAKTYPNLLSFSWSLILGSLFARSIPPACVKQNDFQNQVQFNILRKLKDKTQHRFTHHLGNDIIVTWVPWDRKVAGAQLSVSFLFKTWRTLSERLTKSSSLFCLNLPFSITLQHRETVKLLQLSKWQLRVHSLRQVCRLFHPPRQQSPKKKILQEVSTGQI